MSVNVDAKAVQKVLSKLPAIIQKKVVDKASRASAKVIATEAKKRVARRTGLLARSIGVAKAKPRNTPDGMVRFYVLPKTKVTISRRVVVNGKKGRLKAKTRVFYGHFLEFGTKKMKAKPFLLPAAKATSSKVVSTFKEKVFEEVEKEVRKLS